MKPGTIVWFTGLPAAGKTTLARRVATRMARKGSRPILLDSDELREALSAAVGFGKSGREHFYLTLANLAVLLASQGHLVLVAATAHRRVWRARTRRRALRFLEVFVDAPPELCATRDPKGLYRRAARGKVASLPGVGVTFEPPRAPEVVARGGRDTAALERLLRLLRR